MHSKFHKTSKKSAYSICIEIAAFIAMLRISEEFLYNLSTTAVNFRKFFAFPCWYIITERSFQ